MSAYFLSEAYQSVYKQRLTEDFDDNLRFVDYMTDEDIEAVVESLLWEFQDYGCTMNEAFEFLYGAASPQVITESYEILSEVRNPELRAKARQMKADARVANTEKQIRQTNATSAEVRKNQRASEIKNAITNVRKRLDGPITAVKSAISGAKAGFGMARDGAKNIGAAVNNARKEGQAKLGSLLRTGARKLGLGRVRDAAKAAHHELSGRGARERELKTSFAKNVSNANKARRESERKDFGASVASELRKSPSPTPKTSRPVAAKIDLDIKKVSGNSSGRTSEAEAPKGRTHRRHGRVVSGARPNTSNPVKKTSDRRAAALEKIKAAMSNAPSQGPATPIGPVGTAGRTPGGNIRRQSTISGAWATERSRGPKRLQKAQKQQVNASYEALLDVILEDLIYEGYANNIDEALYIVESISEEALCQITEQYLAE